jgi:hypothetical protein
MQAQESDSPMNFNGGFHHLYLHIWIEACSLLCSNTRAVARRQNVPFGNMAHTRVPFQGIRSGHNLRKTKDLNCRVLHLKLNWNILGSSPGRDPQTCRGIRGLITITAQIPRTLKGARLER